MLLAFVVFVIFGGSNAIGVRFVLRELGPFWSASIRFAIAGLLLAGAMVVMRHPFPRGERLVGTVLFGAIGFGLAYTFLYKALEDAPAGTTMLMLAIVPLLTALLAAGQGVERLRLLGLAGAGVAVLGILVVGADQVSLDVPIVSLLLLLAAATCQAESGIVVKRFPPGDPVAANAVGMLLGAGMLAVVAMVSGEPLVIPTRAETWLSMAYLIGPGSIAVFLLVLYVLERWTASVTSYAFLLFPLVAIAFGALLLDESVQPSFLIGGAIVLAGVYIGAVHRPRERSTAGG
ncbi:MAG TPA: EamA family transporter [Candidatus Limnocylindrales bacterium]|nr:EamA family transporter [Candidatus Limnocylindrales bacterium]